MTPPQIVSTPPKGFDLENAQMADVEQRSLDMDEKKIDETTPYTQDAFGDEEHAEVQYKTLRWWQCGLLMVAETVSLGVLSLPAAVAGLGLVPAVIILVCLGLLATYTGYIIGQFKWAYPQISNMADAGEVIAGRFGRELLGAAQIIFMVFVMASHLLTFVIAMNAITEHGTCSIVFGVVGLVLSFVLSLPRTLAEMSWLSLVSFISILTAVVITMIGVGVSHPGKEVLAVVDTDLAKGFAAVCNIVFSFCGHAAFFGLAAELKNPRDFPKALCLLQGIDISLYLIAAVVIYRFGGDGVASPALGSASPIVSKVAYGIALPTIVIAGVIYGHIASKYVYTRVFRGTDRIHKRDRIAVGSWVGIALGLWIIAWIIAEAIPVFSSLLSLITALFASWFTFGLSGIFWLFLNWGNLFSSPKKIFLMVVNVFNIAIGVCLCVLGLYASGTAIHNDPGSASFSCANNA